MQRFDERYIVYIDTGLTMNERSAAMCQSLFDHDSVIAFESKLPWAFILYLDTEDVDGQRDLTEKIRRMILENEELSEFGYGTASGSVFLEFVEGFDRDFQGPAIDLAKDRVKFKKDLLRTGSE